MHLRIKKALTSRRTVLSLLVILTLCLMVASILPQKELSGGRGNEWFGQDTFLAEAGRWLGLDHLIGTPWFAAIIAVFCLSLMLSTYDQFKASMARTTQKPQSTPDDNSGELRSPPDTFFASLRKRGYRRLSEHNGAQRFVKAPWGYWGSFLFHCGMAVAVLFWFVYIVTEHRAIVRLIEGLPVLIEEGAYPEKKGILAGKLDMPRRMRLERLAPEFWEDDQLKLLTSEVTFIDDPEKSEKVRTSISDKTRYRGMLIYQQSTFGNIFLLEFQGPSGESFSETLPLPMPQGRDKAGYGDFPFRDPTYVLKAKYYADAEKKTVYPNNPLLVLRLVKGDSVDAEVSLRIGESGLLGPYRVRLHDMRWWCDVLIDGSMGTAGIFVGFGMILGGILIAYFFAPREVMVWRTERGYNIVWRAGRFREFYRPEERAIMAFCKGADGNG